MRGGAVVVLERATDLACAHQFDAIEREQHADVVGNVGQGRVEQARDLVRGGLAADAQSLEDALPQRVRQRFGEIGIEWSILSGIRAGERHSPIEQCLAEPGPGRPSRIGGAAIQTRRSRLMHSPARSRSPAESRP